LLEFFCEHPAHFTAGRIFAWVGPGRREYSSEVREATLSERKNSEAALLHTEGDLVSRLQAIATSYDDRQRYLAL
jgi:hypothetical protein